MISIYATLLKEFWVDPFVSLNLTKNREVSMKYISLIISVVLVMTGSACMSVKTTMNRKIEFTINAYSTEMSGLGIVDGNSVTQTKELVFDKPIPLIKIDDNDVYLTKIEKFTNSDNFEYYAPVTDKEGNPVLVDFKNKLQFSNTVIALFHRKFDMKLTGYEKRIQVSMIYRFLDKIQVQCLFSDDEGVVTRKPLDLAYSENGEAFLKDNRYSLFIFDEDLMYQVEKYNGNGYDTTVCKPINVETLPEEEKKTVVGWRDFHINMGTGYFKEPNAGLGYLELNVNQEYPNGFYRSNGTKRITLHKNVEFVNGKLMVDADLVATQLGGVLEWKKSKGTDVFKKIVYLTQEKSEYHELEFTVGSKKASFDGKEVH